MQSILRRALVLSAYLSLAACATTALESQTKQHDPRQARIYILRESNFVFSGGAPNVIFDGQQVGTVGNGSYFFVDRAPGPHTITLETPLTPGRFTVKVTTRAGGVHYLKVAPRQEYLMVGLAFGAIGEFVDAAVSENSGSYTLAPLDERAGAAMLAELKR
jgi:hypothetical protein